MKQSSGSKLQRDHKLHPSVYLRILQRVLSTLGTGDITKVHASITSKWAAKTSHGNQPTLRSRQTSSSNHTACENSLREQKAATSGANNRTHRDADCCMSATRAHAGEIFFVPARLISQRHLSRLRFLCMHNEWVFFSQAQAVCSMGSSFSHISRTDMQLVLCVYNL